jgi:hypothetical protein
MNNEQQQIIDKVYESALIEYGWESLPSTPTGTWFETMEHFIHKCKTDPEFSEKWGLKIDERELSRNERSNYYYKNGNSEGIVVGSLDRPIWEEDSVAHKWYDDKNIPTKLITITYNDKTIESYE